MRTGNRKFTYPVLNSIQINSSYKEGFTFILHDNNRIIDNEKGTITIQGVYCEITSPFLFSLVEQGKAEICYIVECSQTLYREKFSISTTPQDIVLYTSNICGKYYCSAFVVLKENHKLDSSVDEFSDDYSDLKVTLKKHSVLAIDDLHKDVVSPTYENVRGIFNVIKDDSYDDDKCTFDFSDDSIDIRVSKNAFDSYNASKDFKALKPFHFSIIAIPSLIYSIDRVIYEQNKYNEFPDKLSNASSEYLWFLSFLDEFKNKNGRDFDENDFVSSLSDIVQSMFAFPSGKSIIALANANFHFSGGPEDED